MTRRLGMVLALSLFVGSLIYLQSAPDVKADNQEACPCGLDCPCRLHQQSLPPPLPRPREDQTLQVMLPSSSVNLDQHSLLCGLNPSRSRTRSHDLLRVRSEVKHKILKPRRLRLVTHSHDYIEIGPELLQV